MTMVSEADHHYMARALHLAERETFSPHPNPRVGCVLVRDEEIVGEGWHVQAGQAHAEVNALGQAGQLSRGATAYVTLEPCSHHGRTPPCADALIDAGVSRVVVAMQDPNPQVAGQGLQRLLDAGIEVSHGLMSSEAEKLNRGFIKRMRTGRPWVRTKIAASLDGRTALATGESRWITGEDARRDVQRLRARSDVVMSGIGTVLSDNPSLTVREEQLGEPVRRQPLRAVLDSHLIMEPSSLMLSLDGKTLVFASESDDKKCAQLTASGAEVVAVADDEGRTNLGAVLDELGRRGCNEVLVEAGPTLNGALLQQDLIDEMVFYFAPHIMGADAHGMFNLLGLTSMEERVSLKVEDIRAVGNDWRITARLQR